MCGCRKVEENGKVEDVVASAGLRMFETLDFLLIRATSDDGNNIAVQAGPPFVMKSE